MNLQICVDASFVLKLVLDEEGSNKVHALWSAWLARDCEIVAPCHLAFEVTSVLRNHVYRAKISPEAGRRALEAVHAQEIKLIHYDMLNERAWELAERFNRPTAYDAYYLALGQTTKCDLWTADKRLYNAVKEALDWVKWLGDYVPVE